MKKIFILITGITFLFSSCAVHNPLTTNSNNNTTEVVLSKKNFKVIESVQGEAQAMYVFGIGGLSKKAMVAEARANMLSKSNIVGGSKAIINETVEIKHSLFPIVRLYKVTVSGHIVEFTE
jgi:PBP1b-binding outer membrane lipoprotein LpoB